MCNDGTGASLNQSDRGTAIEKAKKEATTDGTKRALRLFGNGLGLTIYDKQYIDNIRTGKIQSEALDLTRSDTISTSEINANEQMRKRIKAEPGCDNTYHTNDINNNNNYISNIPAPTPVIQSSTTYNNNNNTNANTSINNPVIPLQISTTYNTKSHATTSLSNPYQSTTTIHTPNANTITNPYTSNTAIYRPPVQSNSMPDKTQSITNITTIQPPSFVSAPALNTYTPQQQIKSIVQSNTPLHVPQQQKYINNNNNHHHHPPPPLVHSSSPLDDNDLANLPM